MKLRLLTLLIFSILFACGPSITFEVPQPPSSNSLNRFPKKLLGHYISENQLSYLTISKNQVLKTYDYDIKLDRDSLDEEYTIKGDSLIEKATGIKQFIKVAGDNIVAHINQVDTLFSLSSKNILKKFRGHYFLNTEYEDGWSVTKLSFSKGILTFGEINNKEDLDDLSKIVESDLDTVIYNLKVTRKQFKKFVKEGGFREEEIYYRTKNRFN
ncbi:MAG TPA: hypothetical protein VD908_11180 [Cytophagales bacterium]|nr:hypothetical protein [Cytophagales bacterium]